MDILPNQIPFLFFLATLYSLLALYRIFNRSLFVLGVAVFWLALQGLISYTGFYTVTDTLPPRFILLPVPPLLVIISLFVTSRGRQLIDQADQKWMTLVHIVRIPVELTLFRLFVHGLVPEGMTFEGWNYDILSGITAMLFYYLYFVRQVVGKKVLMAWNVVCLLLLLNIVITAALSAPSPVQQLAFDQPNVGVLHFPFTWLPGFIVPVVLFAHLATMRQLLKK